MAEIKYEWTCLHSSIFISSFSPFSADRKEHSDMQSTIRGFRTTTRRQILTIGKTRCQNGEEKRASQLLGETKFQIPRPNSYRSRFFLQSDTLTVLLKRIRGMHPSVSPFSPPCRANLSRRVFPHFATEAARKTAGSATPPRAGASSRGEFDERGCVPADADEENERTRESVNTLEAEWKSCDDVVDARGVRRCERAYTIRVLSSSSWWRGIPERSRELAASRRRTTPARVRNVIPYD